MKKLMTMMLAVIPFGMMGQNAEGVYAAADDIFSSDYAEVERVVANEEKSDAISVVHNTEEDITTDDMFTVTDMLLADPDFDVQEDMITYTKDLKTVYFSANRKLKLKGDNLDEVKIKKSAQLQLFKASVQENGEWTNLEMLPVNGKNHSTGYPALNGDETKLYFVADGPLSTGKTDIFMVDLLEDGSYGQAKNLGAKINSEEREVSPSLDDNDVLYFASDVETEGEELNAFASVVIDSEPTTPIKLDVAADSSKEEYMAAFKAMDAEAMRLAENEANLRDLEILMEAESLAEMDRIKEEYKDLISGAAYNFDSENVVYTVQIGAFQQDVSTVDYADSSVLFNHSYDDGYNRFYSGVFKSTAEAQAHLATMKKEGYEDAFVLGLTGKKRFLPE